MKTFGIEINIYNKLTEKELWPDGDGPENPTEEDVKKLIEKHGGIANIIKDWNLYNDWTSRTKIYEIIPIPFG